MPTTIEQQTFTRTAKLRQTALTYTVSFTEVDTTQTQTEVISIDELKLDLPTVSNYELNAGSLSFTLAGQKYSDLGGTLQAARSPTTGQGTPAGSINYADRAATLTTWVAGQNNTGALNSAMAELPPEAIGKIVFRTPVAPLQVGSLQILFDLKNGDRISLSADDQGFLVDDQGTEYGYADQQSGVVDLTFRGQVDPLTGFISSGSSVDPESIRYNAVAFTYLPLDSELIGIDTVRLPVDGRVPFIRKGDTAALIEKKYFELPTAVAGDVHLVGDVRLSDLKLVDSAGLTVDYADLSIDLDAGTVELLGTFDPSAYTLPITAEFHIMDLSLVQSVDISGRVVLSSTITHDYSENAVCSSLCIFGDQQARVFGLFSQKSWTTSFSDNLIGDPAESQYQSSTNPIEVVNKHAIKERWALVFTSSTGFRIVGETVGEIGSGTTTADISPINPVTGQPYFTIRSAGWGIGWDANNVLRFNTDAPKPGAWVGSAVLQHQVGQQDAYSFELSIHANVDREAS